VIARRHEVSRLEAFSDAVFAFALALLVVSIEAPSSYAELVDRMRGGVSFACCFALLVWIWHEHNSFFRRFGLQDGVTIFLNALLLFVVLLYVYPLKFMFDSLLARFAPRLKPPEPMQLWELANAATIYSIGFIAIFVLFAMFYWRALARRDELALSELEVFDARRNIGHHLISAGVGFVSLAIASFGPLQLAPIAPTTYCLMGPVHFWYGSRSGRKRRLLEAQLAGRPAMDPTASAS
jgi:Endosomal/lysosomal potassium channel TMEM175